VTPDSVFVEDLVAGIEQSEGAVDKGDGMSINRACEVKIISSDSVFFIDILA
jgi:hypothetical protein